MSTSSSSASPKLPIIEQIVQALSGLEFGAVEVTVHHGRIVQIERREKLRCDESRNGARSRTDSFPHSKPTGSPEVSR